MYFASDNSGPVCPEILHALTRANQAFAPSYGADDITQQAQTRVREKFEAPDATLYLVATGSAANVLALSALSEPWETIFCTADSHIHQDECNAIEFFGGNKLTLVPGDDKINPEALHEEILRQEQRGVHGPQRGPVSITQITEKGSLYSLDELHSLTHVAHEFNLPVHMDGARFANALVALGCSPADMTWKAGIDVVSFGGTKNGCLQLEAVIFFDPGKAREFELRRKRGAHLLSKHRFIAAQMVEYLREDLWLRCARNANARARQLAEGLQKANFTLLAMPRANMVFTKMSRATYQRLKEAGVTFYLWNSMEEGPAEETITARFVCDWFITPEQIDEFLQLI